MTTAVPKVSDLYAKSLENSRNAWRNNGDMPQASTRTAVRVDATAKANVPDSDDGARFDAVARDSHQKLEAARARNADWRSAWLASTGDHVPTFAEVAGQ